MPNLSAVEIMVVLGLALIVLGPQKLPQYARQAGKVLTELRQMAAGFQNEMRQALDDASITDVRTAPTPLAPPPREAGERPPLSPPGTAPRAPGATSGANGNGHRPLAPPDTTRA